MKNLLIFFSLLFCTIQLYAQEDRFSDVSQIMGKDVFITDNSALNVAFMIVDNKVKPIKKIKNVSISLSGKVYSVDKDKYTYKKDSYIVLKGDNETILLKPEDSPIYLSSFISKTYWQEKYDNYRNDYTYLNFKKNNQFHSANATIEYDDLTRIEWRGLEINDNGALYHICEYNGVHPLEDFKVSSKFFDESKDEIFIKSSDIQPFVDKYNMRLANEKREKEIADSIANYKLRLAVALKDAQFMDGDREIKISKGDTLAIFSYNSLENKYVARHRYSNLLFEPGDLEFLDSKRKLEKSGRYEIKTVILSADAEFLKEKGDEGKEQRFKVAAEYDNAQTDIWIAKLEKFIDDYDKEVAYKKKNQIFITGIGYDYDSNE